jgi:KDO2-lipid IV(A) lauroyltransferase
MSAMTRVREWLEYAALWVVLKFAGILPRRGARAFGVCLSSTLFAVRPRVRRIAMLNLQLAFPNLSEAERKHVVKGMVHQLGWMAGEFSQFPKYARGARARAKLEQVVLLDGLENFLAGERGGKGVLFLTGHLGAWELAPFAQALYGHPLHFLVRPVNNARVDALVNSYRTLSGNKPIEKNQSARAVLRILSEGGTVGILADQNTNVEEGAFVNFFGIPACTTTGIARIALHTGAAVVPGYIYWDAKIAKYRLQLEPPVELVRTGDMERDVRENTARFTKIVEDFIRRYPEQWIWVHKRWKTRPSGEKSIYPN